MSIQRDKLETKYDQVMNEYTNATGERQSQLRDQLLAIEQQRTRLEQDRKG
jgi:hypothetical protein